MATYPPIFLYGSVITTADEYKAAQRRAMSQARRVPVKATTTPPVLEQNYLRVKCACGNYPIVMPETRLACCLLCGLYYENLDVPEDAG